MPANRSWAVICSFEDAEKRLFSELQKHGFLSYRLHSHFASNPPLLNSVLQNLLYVNQKTEFQYAYPSATSCLSTGCILDGFVRSCPPLTKQLPVLLSTSVFSKSLRFIPKRLQADLLHLRQAFAFFVPSFLLIPLVCSLQPSRFLQWHSISTSPTEGFLWAKVDAVCVPTRALVGNWTSKALGGRLHLAWRHRTLSYLRGSQSDVQKSFDVETKGSRLDRRQSLDYQPRVNFLIVCLLPTTLSIHILLAFLQNQTKELQIPPGFIRHVHLYIHPGRHLGPCNVKYSPSRLSVNHIGPRRCRGHRSSQRNQEHRHRHAKRRL